MSLYCFLYIFYVYVYFDTDALLTSTPYALTWLMDIIDECYLLHKPDSNTLKEDMLINTQTSSWI